MRLTTSASVSSIQSRPVIPRSNRPSATYRGITGRDWIEETEADVVSLTELHYSKATARPIRVVLAVDAESEVKTVGDLPAGLCVHTEYPELTRRYFAEHGHRAEIVPVSGAVEITPHLGIADVIVDLTSTGSTLKVNGLRELATVLESSARLIAAPGSVAVGGATPTDKQRTLEELVMALGSVLRARDKRYVMANVPRAALEQVKQVLPGLTGPTVIDIMNGGERGTSYHVAVHAVVSAATIYRTIAQLKALGGEGILVTRIERLMP